MKNRLIQILGDMWEELWYFPVEVSDEQIQKLFNKYRDSDYETFEEYMENESDIKAKRVFVDAEIIIEN